MDPATGPPQGTLLGDMWRAIPRGWKILGGLVLLGLAAWGGWRIVETIRRAAFREEVRAFLAGLPPAPSFPAVAEEDNAAPLYLEAFAAMDRGAIRFVYNEDPGKWTPPPPEVVGVLEDNVEALRLFEAALEKPGFEPGPSPPAGASPDPGACWHLGALSQVRALVALRGGRIGEAVRFALFVPRMTRRIGPGRAPPWNVNPLWSFLKSLGILESAVADPRLDEAAAEAILRHLPSGEEARAAAVAEFEATEVRASGAFFVELLGEDGEAVARARGWRPPSLPQRLMATFGAGMTRGGWVAAFPSAGEFRDIWESILEHRKLVGLRGAEVVARCGPASGQLEAGDMVGQAAEARLEDLRGQIVTEARLEVLRAAAALRLFEIRRGAEPASLEELVPAFLPAPSKDPFSDGALRYEVLPDGWKVRIAVPAGWWVGRPHPGPGIRWNRTSPVPQEGGK